MAEDDYVRLYYIRFTSDEIISQDKIRLVKRTCGGGRTRVSMRVRACVELNYYYACQCVRRDTGAGEHPAAAVSLPFRRVFACGVRSAQGWEAQGEKGERDRNLGGSGVGGGV